LLILLGFAGALVPQLARAQFYTNGCGQNYVAYPGQVPPINVHLSRNVNAAGGGFIGDWQEVRVSGAGSGDQDAFEPWSMCTHAQLSAGAAGGADNNIWAVGIKPSTVKPVDPANSAITTVEVDGQTYYVFTTNALEAVRVGFIVRWRVANHWGEAGTWRSPGPGWATNEYDPSAGLPFYRFFVHWMNWELAGIGGAPPPPVPALGDTYGCWSKNPWHPGCDIQGRYSPNYNVLNSVGDWNTLSTYIANSGAVWGNQYVVIMYGARVQIRYVLLDVVNRDELDPGLHLFPNIPVITMRNRPNAGYAVGGQDVQVTSNLTIRIMPWGTCTTPSVEQWINLGTVWADQLQNAGDTANQRDFELEFSKCPRNDIGYYFHSNGVWVDNANGVLGLDSTASAADVGIQIRHNDPGHEYGTQPVEFNQDGHEKVYWSRYPGPWATNVPGSSASTGAGVTHKIPLRASIYRTNLASDPITPGKIRASLIFVIQYP